MCEEHAACRQSPRFALKAKFHLRKLRMQPQHILVVEEFSRCSTACGCTTDVILFEMISSGCVPLLSQYFLQIMVHPVNVCHKSIEESARVWSP